VNCLNAYRISSMSRIAPPHPVQWIASDRDAFWRGTPRPAEALMSPQTRRERIFRNVPELDFDTSNLGSSVHEYRVQELNMVWRSVFCFASWGVHYRTLESTSGQQSQLLVSTQATIRLILNGWGSPYVWLIGCDCALDGYRSSRV